MKKLIARSFAFLLLSVLAVGTFAQAQQSERTIKANIPFDFSVGNRIFPAGRYALVRVEPSVLELRDYEGRVLASVLTQSIQSLTAPAQPRLLFDGENGAHALTQVWQPNESIGQRLQPTKSLTRAVQKASHNVQTAQVNDQR
jgi:hypothetical protein